MAVKFTRRHKPKAMVDMVPMIDIVFQLVIFFMVATTFKTTSGMELELPNAENLTEITKAPLNITIINRDKIEIGDYVTNIDDFEDILTQKVVKNKTSIGSVVLYGDKNMEYQLLIDIMDILRLHGFESVDLAVDRKR